MKSTYTYEEVRQLLLKANLKYCPSSIAEKMTDELLNPDAKSLSLQKDFERLEKEFFLLKSRLKDAVSGSEQPLRTARWRGEKYRYNRGRYEYESCLTGKWIPSIDFSSPFEVVRLLDEARLKGNETDLAELNGIFDLYYNS